VSNAESGEPVVSNDPSDQANPIRPQEAPPSGPPEKDPAEHHEQPADVGTESADQKSRRRILIGSQRDPAAYRARQRRDWTPVPDSEAQGAAEAPKATEASEANEVDAVVEQPPAPQPPVVEQPNPEAASPESEIADTPAPPRKFPPPNLRDRLPDDLERELQDALGDAPVDELLAGTDAVTRQGVLQSESQHTGRVVAVYQDYVFVELGSREQGGIPVRQFAEPPEPGTTLDVIVQRFNPEDGLYELSVPNAAADVGDWADLKEGMLVEARVTGHNTGGLECEVNRLRGFIPMSQISLYRVEDLAPYVDQKFTCLVTEANPQRRNLVLSRRAVLEREQEETRQQFLDSLQPGQVHEGVVRKLVDFGAFVDLGGVDGLLHISQLAWEHINHPSDVLSEGQKIKVKIEKVNPTTRKINLGYRDMLENPWTKATEKYPVNSTVRGTVSKLMEFGAFVRLEAGVEGLVHISELSHKHVRRTSDVLSEGDEVEVLVLSVDPKAERISLSMKALSAEPEPTERAEDASATAPKRKRRGPDKPLRGGLGRSAGGEKWGLNW
jgi:small subunit ribosomal protein S1